MHLNVRDILQRNSTQHLANCNYLKWLTPDTNPDILDMYTGQCLRFWGETLTSISFLDKVGHIFTLTIVVNGRDYFFFTLFKWITFKSLNKCFRL